MSEFVATPEEIDSQTNSFTEEIEQLEKVIGHTIQPMSEPLEPITETVGGSGIDSGIRYVYLREDNNNRQPIGCVAYDCIGDDFIYGYSIFHPEDGCDMKSGIRNIAAARLELARAGSERRRCRGKFGRVSISGNRFSEKVANMLTIIHDNDDTRDRTKQYLSRLIEQFKDTKPKSTQGGVAA